MKTDIELNEELASFSRIWKGGFRTGYSVKRNQKGIETYLKENNYELLKQDKGNFTFMSKK